MMIEGIKLDHTLVDLQTFSDVTLVDNLASDSAREQDTAVVVNITPMGPEASQAYTRKVRRQKQLELWSKFKVLDFDAYLSAIITEPGVSLRPSKVATF